MCTSMFSCFLAERYFSLLVQKDLFLIYHTKNSYNKFKFLEN